jgi:ornithine cyclodeaminase/alanine dehydrogenase-like protein (mu-crystallin family)
VFGDWIKPGATVCGLGSYQELDETVITRARRIFVDHREGCAQRGNLAPLIKAGRLGQDRIDGEVAEVVAGRLVGRASVDETVVIALIGIGSLDIALAARALERAAAGGRGQTLVANHALG